MLAGEKRGSIHPVNEYSLVTASLMAEFYQRSLFLLPDFVHVVILVTFDVHKAEPHLPAGRKKSRGARQRVDASLDEASSG